MKLVEGAEESDPRDDGGKQPRATPSRRLAKGEPQGNPSDGKGDGMREFVEGKQLGRHDLQIVCGQR